MVFWPVPKNLLQRQNKTLATPKEVLSMKLDIVALKSTYGNFSKSKIEHFCQSKKVNLQFGKAVLRFIFFSELKKKLKYGYKIVQTLVKDVQFGIYPNFITLRYLWATEWPQSWQGHQRLGQTVLEGAVLHWQLPHPEVRGGEERQGRPGLDQVWREQGTCLQHRWLGG